MKNCLILDDEQHAINILTAYIDKVPSLRLTAALKNPVDALRFIQKVPIDVAFIDVQMPQLTGLQFLKLLDAQTQVVLCTAYAQYAVDGFDLNVVDYLLKPFSLDRFIQCVRKIEHSPAPAGPGSHSGSAEEPYIFVKTELKGNYVRVGLNDVLFIEGLGNYLKIHLLNKPIICSMTIKNMEEQLEEYGFIRVHKSYVVAKNKITQVQGNTIYVENHPIPIGDNYRNTVASFLKDHFISN